jgi:ketosteroid isomerase-like protein
MKRILLVFAACILGISTPAFAQQEDVMAAVNRFGMGYNNGDLKMMNSVCAEQTSIVDDFPPHEWHGADACVTWFKDYGIDAKKNGITDPQVTLGKPSHVDVSGDRAYVVVPATYTFKQKGAPMKEVGASLTIALRKDKSGWRITGWTWTKGTV